MRYEILHRPCICEHVVDVLVIVEHRGQRATQDLYYSHALNTKAIIEFILIVKLSSVILSEQATGSRVAFESHLFLKKQSVFE